jgi:hypothetical protein
MVRMLKQLLVLAVLVCGGGQAGAFSLLGPIETTLPNTWQIGTIGYNLGGDIGGPQQLGEEYRVGYPVVYYACDANYLDYFGSNGVVAAELAAEIFNQVTNVSALSPELSEYPMQPFRVNYQAQALTLYDLKTVAAWVMAWHIGLAEPERYVWTLRDRVIGPGGCPDDVTYYIVKRNFDPVLSGLDQPQPSSYVNGTLYSYEIIEFCSGVPDPIADAVEFAVDPTADTFTSLPSYLGGGFAPGKFLTTLGRDDVAGLRYLLRTNNVNIESTGEDTVAFITNNTVQLLYTSNLTTLAEAALVNNAAALTALFPGLQIGSTISWFTNVVTTNTYFYFANSPFDPAGTPPRLYTGYQVTTNIATHYQHSFANVITNQYSTSGVVTVLTTNVSTTACGPFVPPGTICTNVTVATYYTNGVFGDYILFPTNSCGISIVATQLVSTLFTTNASLVATNVSGATNAANVFFSQTVINVYTQSVFQVKLVECPENPVALRQGVNAIRFERREFDSLLNRFFYPITNEYTSRIITNSTMYSQKVRRIVTTPDYLFSAQDSGAAPYMIEYVQTQDLFDFDNANANLNGPGRLRTQVEFRFNKTGPLYINHPVLFPGSLDEQSQQTLIIWSSFDGSTNAPVIYPNGTSLENLENQILIQISPAGPALPNATLGVNYSNLFSGFSVVGGTAPYTWSLPAAGLPPGLSLHPATGQISGVPTIPNVYDFTVRMMDSMSRFVDRTYSITVTP